MSSTLELEEIVWKDFDELEEVETQWLIKDVLPENSLVCLFGKRGLGKTFLTMDIALSIATGLPTWNGYKVKQRKVAYLLAERPEGLKRRIRGWLQMRAKNNNEILQRLKDNIIFAKAAHPIDRDEGEKAILDAVGGKFPEDESVLLVIDPLIAFYWGNENDSAQMQRFVTGIRNIAGPKYTVLVVHHEGKGNDFYGNKGARGSSALEAGMDTVLRLKALNDKTASLEVTKQRDAAEIPDIYFGFEAIKSESNQDLGLFLSFKSSEEVASEVGKRDNESLIRQAEIFDIIKEETIGSKGWISRANINKILEGRIDKMPANKTFHKLLDKLVEEKKIKQKAMKGNQVQYKYAGETFTIANDDIAPDTAPKPKADKGANTNKGKASSKKPDDKKPTPSKDKAKTTGAKKANNKKSGTTKGKKKK